MTDERYMFIQDSKEKKNIARSARSTRTHCGKRGAVKFPSDYLSRKELKAMNGECKSYRMNEPMNWDEFKSLPDDLKVIYIKALREKFGVPDMVLADYMGVTRVTLGKYMRCLGLGLGKSAGAESKRWNRKAEFDAWWYAVPAEAISEDTVAEQMSTVDDKDIVEDVTTEAAVTEAEEGPRSVPEIIIGDTAAQVKLSTEGTDKIFVKYADRIDELRRGYERAEESHCDNAPYCQEKKIRDAAPIAFAGNSMPVIPKSGTLTFAGNNAEDALKTIMCLLGSMRVNLTVSWEAAE